jgi:ribosomal protein L5
MYSKNYYEKRNLIKCFNYKNIHKVPFPITKMTLFYTIKKDISLKSLIRISAFLELITGQRSFFFKVKKIFYFFEN